MKKKLLMRYEFALKSISKMLNDILDVYQLENNALTLDKNRFDIKSVAQKIIDEFRVIKGDEVDLDMQLESDPFEVFGDRDLLHRVLANLIQNAYKLTKSGYIRIRGGYGDSGAWIEVWDTGPGIPELYRQNIFSKFNRIERQGQPGVSRGLGLAFCRLVISAHGGKIEALENPEGGTRMRFEIPFEK
jgi:signal transduction histidine kinase